MGERDKAVRIHNLARREGQVRSSHVAAAGQSAPGVAAEEAAPAARTAPSYGGARGEAVPDIADFVSLVPDTLKGMAGDAEFQRAAQELRDLGQAALTAKERKKRRRALDRLGIPSFEQFAADKGGGGPLRRREVTTLQVNIGLYCNQACSHCHVESSPLRTEMMAAPAVERLLRVLEASPAVATVDVTGGAPELNRHFRHLVAGARLLGREVIDRCNLTVLLEPGQEDLAEFLAQQRVTVVASLPCYSEGNVDLQRGRGVFERSIRGLRLLNSLGYGREGTGLQLHLVYNPVGPHLPPPQAALERDYKEELRRDFGVEFNNLFTITNMPIKRYADYLHRTKKLEEYMDVLVNSFNVTALQNVMCTNLISVRWDGALFDCDFNQQLALPMPAGSPATIFELESFEDLVGRRITVDSHCFGCTAGQGSSCTGAVA